MIKKMFIGSLLVVSSLTGFANENPLIKKKSNHFAGVPSEDPYLELANNIQRYAKKFMGINYVWGGKVASGFDCSGLVSYVFAKFGMKIEMPSADLFKLGYDMPAAAALPGDLIFFRQSTNAKSKISHVGIVIEANEKGVKFIHAARGKGVTISYLYEKYYVSHFGGIKRVLDNLK